MSAGIGTYQVLADRREREHTHHPGPAGDGDVAGDLVPGVQEREAEAEGAGYDSGGEDVRMGDYRAGA